MRLALRGEYALRAVIEPGLHYHRDLVQIRTVAASQQIPKRFLDAI